MIVFFSSTRNGEIKLYITEYHSIHFAPSTATAGYSHFSRGPRIAPAAADDGRTVAEYRPRTAGTQTAVAGSAVYTWQPSVRHRHTAQLHPGTHAHKRGTRVDQGRDDHGVVL